LKVQDGTDRSKVVYVVERIYQSEETMNMDGRVRTAYPKTWWPSFMLFSNVHAQARH